MSLISMEFLTFVAVAVIGYYLIPKRYQWVWLLAFSYIYYASSGMKYLVFLLYTTVVTYGTARMIYGADQKFADQKEKIKTYKKSIMLLALILDFGMLAVLKYTNFTISNINTLFHADIRMVKFLLPLGISFYTFQSVGYILDVYWKRYEPEKNIFKFALFVSFFPQILQGPIGRYSNLAHQFYEEHSFDFMRIERGVQRVLWGFFKKMVIADTAAVFVDAIFDQYQTYNGLAIFGVLAYSAQLYGDFSGGMDVVIGIASMFGIEMDENFKRPYFSISITDFWHRWHISLSTWLRDYLYISLGGNRKGKIRTYINLILTMLLGGLWHGASWNFVVWGGLHGVALALHKFFRNLLGRPKQYRSRGIRKFFAVVLTFHFVCFCWIFFRNSTFEASVTMIRQIFTAFHPELLEQLLTGYWKVFALMGVGFLLHFCPDSWQNACSRGMVRMPLIAQALIMIALIYLVIQVKSSDIQPFIYFQF